MCTVTYIKTGAAVYITSSRDENAKREKALLPQTQIWNNTKIFFPKDPLSGGTWFSVNDKGRVLVLLNGADTKHESQYPYQKSRGLIVLELIKQADSLSAFDTIDLENIEPFTIILFENEKLSQLQWDGVQKNIKHPDPQMPHIWSSATLYSKEAILQRRQWFCTFLKNEETLGAEQIVGFHKTPNGDLENGFVIKRGNGVMTQSVTQVALHKNNCHLYYNDLSGSQALVPFRIAH